MLIHCVQLSKHVRSCMYAWALKFMLPSFDQPLINERNSINQSIASTDTPCPLFLTPLSLLRKGGKWQCYGFRNMAIRVGGGSQ